MPQFYNEGLQYCRALEGGENSGWGFRNSFLMRVNCVHNNDATPRLHELRHFDPRQSLDFTYKLWNRPIYSDCWLLMLLEKDHEVKS